MEDYLNKSESIIDRTTESEIFKQLGKRKFFKLVEDCEIDFDKVVLKKKSCNEDFHKFNYVVKKLYQAKKISLVDISIYMYTDLFPIKEVLSCFNEENMWSLRNELGQKHNIKMNKSILHHFLIKGNGR